ncbi:MAG TPA: acetate/propionate family kinase [Mucilaginibacter sp.]|jgi:acetate kinase|nr:acetate/propionate family kinase [Mucilaginibacter sp.]
MILTINGGSSSIKFALYKTGKHLAKVFSGRIDMIGSGDITFKLNGPGDQIPCKVKGYDSDIACLTGLLAQNVNVAELKAIGHRVVQGMQHTAPCLITTELLKELKKFIPYDPDHLPTEIKLIEALQARYPDTMQFVCFDTGFHQTMPEVAKLLSIPRRFTRQGISRYGFHGLSYQYLMGELGDIAGKKAAKGRVILAHLGSGASLCAVYKGKSIDTTMGFTPAGGIPMSSRSGDLDPGVAWIMMKTEKLSPKQFNHIINHESGLLGISETTGDMGELLAQEHGDNRSAAAIEMFCYQVKKWIGTFSAALGGVDMLVFSGGIGENAPVIRTRICEGLGFLGIKLHEKRNHKNASLISQNKGSVSVYVIPTNEEIIIAELVNKMIHT